MWFSVVTGSPRFQAWKAAGEACDCTPMTEMAGSTAPAATQAAAAPLPPPTGTRRTSRSDRASSTSSVAVATPAIIRGSLAEWMYR